MLWTNPSPTSSFAATEISLPTFDEYDYLKIIYRYSTTSTLESHLLIPTEDIPGWWDGSSSGSASNVMSGAIGSIHVSNAGQWYRPLTYVRDGVIKILACVRGNYAAADNKYIIPTSIIGLKY